MKIGILGPTGFSGSHIAIELLNRGHHVVGFSRRPEKLGKHQNYSPVSLAIETTPILDLITAFSGLDTLINAYNPANGPSVYSTPLKPPSPFLALLMDNTRNLPRNIPPPSPHRPRHLPHKPVILFNSNRRHRFPLPPRPRKALPHRSGFQRLLARLPPQHRRLRSRYRAYD